MKHIKQVLLSTGVAAGLLAATSGYGADTQPVKQPTPDNPNPPAQPPPDAPGPDEQTVPQPAQTQPAATNTPTAVPPAAAVTNAAPAVDAEGRFRFNFRNAPIDQVLTYMSKTAGYRVLPNPRVDLSTKVTAWSDQPVNREEALELLKQVMSANGYTMILSGTDDKTLSIISKLEAKHSDIPVVLFIGNPSDVPKTPDIMTYIVPVRSLNAVSLIRDLQPLLPAETTITANESGNALVMTDTQMNVRRVVEIVKALDSVSASSATITVFPLKFADAKTLASIIKDLFPATDAAGGRGGGMNPFATMFGGGRGGRGGGGGDTGSDTGTGHTPTTRITAVADDRSNSLAVSSPDEMVTTIRELINQLDTNVQDLTEMRAFKLKNADPVETADLLTKLFADTSKTDDNNNGFGGRQFRFGGFPGMQQQNNSSGNSSDRTKKINQVVAVPDQRTARVVVTAGKDMMPQIASLIEDMDQDASGKMKVLVFDLKNADPSDVQQVLLDLFPSSNSRPSSTSTGASSALNNRNTQMQNTANSSSTLGSSSGPGGRSSIP